MEWRQRFCTCPSKNTEKQKPISCWLLITCTSKELTELALVKDKSYIGKTLDRKLIGTFPKDIDVCGEQGEYHTLAYDGPLFKYPIEFSISKVYDTSYEFKLEDGSLQTCVYWSASYQL